MRKRILTLVMAMAVLLGAGIPLVGSGTADAHTRCALPAHQGAAQVIANGQNPHDDPEPPATHGIQTAREHSDAIGGCP